jgi:hypothetical protein
MIHRDPGFEELQVCDFSQAEVVTAATSGTGRSWTISSLAAVRIKQPSSVASEKIQFAETARAALGSVCRHRHHVRRLTTRAFLPG